MNDTSGLYSPGRAANAASLEEYKKKLADTQAKIVALPGRGAAQQLPPLRRAPHAGDALDPGEQPPVVVQNNPPRFLPHVDRPGAALDPEDDGAHLGCRDGHRRQLEGHGAGQVLRPNVDRSAEAAVDLLTREDHRSTGRPLP